MATHRTSWGNYTYTETIDIPERFKEGYKDIRVEIKQGPPSKADNDDPDLEPKYKKNWDEYSHYTLQRSANITNYSVSDYTVKLSFTLPTPPDTQAFNVKQAEEANG